MSALLSGGQAFGVEGPSLTSHHVLLHFGRVPSVALALQRATPGVKRVVHGGQPILLTPKEFELLAYLARHRGQIVSRQMLARDVWRESRRATPLDNVIDVHVAHLRKKIDEGQVVKLLHTVRGVGFMLDEGPAGA